MLIGRMLRIVALMVCGVYGGFLYPMGAPVAGAVSSEISRQPKKRKKVWTSPLASPAAHLAHKLNISHAEARALLAQRKKAVPAIAPAPIIAEVAYESEPMSASVYHEPDPSGLFASLEEYRAMEHALQTQNYKVLSRALDTYGAQLKSPCSLDDAAKALSVMVCILSASDVYHPVRGACAIIAACGAYSDAFPGIVVPANSELAAPIIKMGLEKRGLSDAGRADIEYACGYIEMAKKNKERACGHFDEAAKYGHEKARAYLAAVDYQSACNLSRDGQYLKAIEIFERLKNNPAYAARAAEWIEASHQNLKVEREARIKGQRVVQVPTDGVLDPSKKVVMNPHDAKRIHLIVDLLDKMAPGDERRKLFLQQMKELLERNNLKLTSRDQKELDALSAFAAAGAAAVEQLGRGEPAQVGDGLVVPIEAIERLAVGESIQAPNGVRIERISDGTLMLIHPDGDACDFSDPVACAAWNARHISG